MEYNAEATGGKYRDIAKAMGVEGTENMSQEEYLKGKAVDAVKQLSKDVGIPADLKEIVKKRIYHSLHSQHMTMRAVLATKGDKCRRYNKNFMSHLSKLEN